MSMLVCRGPRYMSRYTPALRPNSASFATTTPLVRYGPPSFSCITGIGSRVRSTSSPVRVTSQAGGASPTRGGIGWSIACWNTLPSSRSAHPIPIARRRRVAARPPTTPIS